MRFWVALGYVTQKRGVSNTPIPKRLDFDDFVCIFAAVFGIDIKENEESAVACNNLCLIVNSSACE